MATALTLKRKNIDLPIEAWQKLSILAAANGMSLKKYVESILIDYANSINIDITKSPKPE